MSFAIIQTGGKQYKVKASDILKIEKIENKKSNKIEFDQVLAYGNEKTIELGSPIVKGAKVEAELIKNGKNRTVLVFKKRRRKNSRRKNGHRQQYSLIQIKKIFSKDGSIFSELKKEEKKVTK
tara:strand:- start:56 stop:424 length:369 start_codon:yes stop_codon:yes gene_type:complete